MAEPSAPEDSTAPTTGTEAAPQNEDAKKLLESANYTYEFWRKKGLHLWNSVVNKNNNDVGQAEDSTITFTEPNATLNSGEKGRGTVTVVLHNAKGEEVHAQVTVSAGGEFADALQDAMKTAMQEAVDKGGVLNDGDNKLSLINAKDGKRMGGVDVNVAADPDGQEGPQKQTVNSTKLDEEAKASVTKLWNEHEKQLGTEQASTQQKSQEASNSTPQDTANRRPDPELDIAAHNPAQRAMLAAVAAVGDQRFSSAEAGYNGTLPTDLGEKQTAISGVARPQLEQGSAAGVA